MSDPNILLMQYIEVIKRQLREQMSEQVGIKEKTKEDIIVQEPNLWHVVYYNDNVTPMDFVIVILMEAFNFSFQKASAITMQVHEQGKGIAGAYSKEIASMKVKRCNQIARSEGHPLLITMEAE